MSRRLTRRQLLVRLGGGALVLSGCGSARGPAGDGSTLRATFADPTGAGVLRPEAGQPLLHRTELAPRAQLGAELARLAHLTDAHVLDAQSPARVTFLDRLGPPFTSTFRPQEALTAQVLDGAVRAVNAFRPHAVIQGGDLIDNDQSNELAWAVAVLRGGRALADSGTPGYHGVQSASNPDPFYYRPDLDAPRHPGLLAAATTPFTAAGLRAPWYPVLGDHDVLVQGVLAPTPTTRSISLGSRAVYELPPDLRVPSGRAGLAAGAPDGVAVPATIDQLLAQTLAAPSVSVAPDPRRTELDVPEALARLRRASGRGGSGPALDYAFDLGASLRVIVLDLVRRAGGSGGQVRPEQLPWVAGQLARAGARWVLMVSHQPLGSSAGGESVLALLDRHPRVLAAISGHTHHNRIDPRPGASGGGYWLIQTASLIDYPQQARALRVLATAGGGAALQTWMLDHAGDGSLGHVSRELSYLDAQGGRPQDFAGDRRDRNVTLYLPAPSPVG